MSSIRAVAREAGVSVATVSRALSHPDKVSDESLDKVHRAIEKVGYRPNMLARNFRSARSYTIVVLVPDITNPFYSQLIRSIEDRAQQKGYAVLLGDTRHGAPDREQEYVRRVETRLADGVIQLRPHSEKQANHIPPGIACVHASSIST
jgi:LacI family transcriptional regulator, repressor for deo operon, udp, cdd, tsx, nupC, and nupG